MPSYEERLKQQEALMTPEEKRQREELEKKLLDEVCFPPSKATGFFHQRGKFISPKTDKGGAE